MITHPEISIVDHWKYRAEGNANLVLEYVGPDARLKPALLRLRKAQVENDTLSTRSMEQRTVEPPTLSGSANDAIQPVELSKEPLFISSVIGLLLGQEYIEQLIPIQLEQEFLQKLAVSVASDRPDHRQHKDIDCSQRMGFLILDHTKFVRPLSNRRSICVEIKPKWGFLPTSAFIREEHAIKRRKCRFCMYQYSKIHLGIEDDKSEYCPIDLFSGEDPLVQGALDALVKTPQNNLRVFVDGVSQQPVSAEVVDQIIAGSTKSNSLGTDQKAATTTGRQVAFTDVLTHILVRSSLLKRLGRLQQGLDSLDVQVIHQFYQQVLLDSTNASRLPEPTLEEFQNTAQAFMERMDFDAMMTEDRDIFEMQLKSSLGFGPEDELEDIPRELEMHFIREFLLSATLKDCSIMITIRKCGDEEAIATTEQQENDKDESSFCLGVFSEATHKVKIGDEMFEYKIICVDLDPKKIKSVPMYLKKDKDIVDHYLSTAGEREPSCGAY